jgi:hypothetical protein
MVRICSEHVIGFLKGQFASLKHLRINIIDEASHMYTTYWIAACICLHNFAMECEDRESPNHDKDEPTQQDPLTKAYSPEDLIVRPISPIHHMHKRHEDFAEQKPNVNI